MAKLKAGYLKDPQVTVTVTVGVTSLIRNVAVSYSSSVNNIFASIGAKIVAV